MVRLAGIEPATLRLEEPPNGSVIEDDEVG